MGEDLLAHLPPLIFLDGPCSCGSAVVANGHLAWSKADGWILAPRLLVIGDEVRVGHVHDCERAGEGLAFVDPLSERKESD